MLIFSKRSIWLSLPKYMKSMKSRAIAAFGDFLLTAKPVPPQTRVPAPPPFQVGGAATAHLPSISGTAGFRQQLDHQSGITCPASLPSWYAVGMVAPDHISPPRTTMKVPFSTPR